MAKLKGILKIKGTLDELTFYKSGKDYLVRTKGGVDADRIANDPNFQRTRENGSEFGMAATAGKLLRVAVRNLMINAKDRLVTSRLTKVMTQIKNLDIVNSRGERHVHEGVLVPGGQALLQGFNFNIKSILSSIFFAQYTHDTLTGEIDIPSIVSINDVVAPRGATHMAIKSGWTIVNFQTGDFSTEMSNVETIAIDASTQAVNLAFAQAPTGTGTSLQLMHLEFFQEVNGQLYSLKNGAYNSLSVLAVENV